MAVTSITYSADAAIAVTAWDTGLTTGLSATSAIFDNTTTKYMDLLVGGIIELGATTPVVGDSLDIYVGALYDKDVTSTPGGGIDSWVRVTNGVQIHDNVSQALLPESRGQQLEPVGCP